MYQLLAMAYIAYPMCSVDWRTLKQNDSKHRRGGEPPSVESRVEARERLACLLRTRPDEARSDSDVTLVFHLSGTRTAQTLTVACCSLSCLPLCALSLSISCYEAPYPTARPFLARSQAELGPTRASSCLHKFLFASGIPRYVTAL